jgi:eukaryotic-like serine/threonine-protein kinase
LSTPLLQDNALIGGRYKVLEFLNQGGMQEVYVAEDVRLKRKVALKVPKSSSATKRFDRSAQLSAKVVHPNVAATFDYFEESDSPYLIEELLEGENLGERFKRDFNALDPHLVAHVLHHLAKGVAAAHHVGIVHRDLKPNNVVVSSDFALEVVKITDFGIARMAAAQIESDMAALNEEQSSITGSQTLVGAIPYMSPEALLKPKDPQKPADIWALGAMAYFMLTGAPPYGAGVQAIAKIIEAEPLPSPPINPCPQFKILGAELWQVIQDCLTKDPAKRLDADALAARCGKLRYLAVPREVGTVKNYRGGTGDTGFLTTKGQDVFFHRVCYYGGKPAVDARVCFASFKGKPSPRAALVLPLKNSTP